MTMQTPSATPAAATGEESRRWFFASAVLDDRTLELRVAGEEVEIERKPYEVLRFLLQHAGEVVTKDELLAGVWPGRFLSDTVLTKCISRIRELLRDDDQSIIKTVYGYGYRLVAPVRVEIQRSDPPPRFDFKPGDHPPARPLWSLVRRLGAGGHGEAWLAQHDKTREQRVFKFAIDAPSLAALKREITLFRLLNDSLGERARIVELLDWNLEQPPYFIESRYLPGGSLSDWAARNGGLGAIPLAARLDVAAQVAEALAAVHSVGVLHKDLKPSNIFVEEAAGNAPAIVLADFGSGGVLDPRRLEALGITRLGFTKTVTAHDGSSGTPLYFAPEVLNGQPPTVKADVYALGVILYQLVVGEFRKALSAGWEHDVDDELLREIIADAAQGEPDRRLADSGEVAQRLRALEQNRARRTAEREAQARAEAASRLLERARARRLGLALAFAALTTGLAASTFLYFEARDAQQRAEAAASQSKAVTDFLSQDVFSPAASGERSVKDLTVVEMLKLAGDEVDTRFAQQPAVAADIHYVIGRSFFGMYDTVIARRHFMRALELSEQLGGAGSAAAVLSVSELVTISYAIGELPSTIERYESVLHAAERRPDADPQSLLELRLRLAKGRGYLGDWARAVRELQGLLADAKRRADNAPMFLGNVEFALGRMLVELARFGEAEPHLRAAIDEFRAVLGDEHGLIAEGRAALGRALAEGGQHAEARVQLLTARDLAEKWAPPDTWTAIRPRFFMGLLLLEQDRPAEAQAIIAPIVEYQEAHEHENPDHQLDQTAVVRRALGEAQRRQGRLAQARATLDRALAIAQRAEGPRHPTTASIRVALAEVLLELGRDAEARDALGGAAPGDFAGLPEGHPFVAQRHRVQGLLAQREGDVAQAREALTKSYAIVERIYGAQNWRVRRARDDLARLAGR